MIGIGGGGSGACHNGHLEIVKFLIAKGANGWNNGFYRAYVRERFEIIQFLISKIEECTIELRRYYQWPDSKEQILKLLHLKTPLNAFRHMHGFQKLSGLVVGSRQAIIGTNVLIPDLLDLVAQCIII